MGNIIGGVGNNNLGFGSLQPFEVPDAFGMVEDGIYRSSVPKAEKQFQYLKTLNLKTILFLSQEIILKSFTSFLEEEKIDLIELGLLISNRTLNDLIKEALEILMDKSYHPIMVVCSSGIHLTGTLIGCLRKLQDWSLTSIFTEYECFAGNNSRHIDQQFIEMFDTDL
ncbi:predicted protein, partial [Naegleria gruberi]